VGKALHLSAVETCSIPLRTGTIEIENEDNLRERLTGLEDERGSFVDA
jgi:hypothetical protein